MGFLIFFVKIYPLYTRNLMTKEYHNIEACVALLSQRCKCLDDLQHSIMHIQYCMRLAALLTVPDKNIEKDINTHFNEMKASAKAWSTMKFVRFVHSIFLRITRIRHALWSYNCIGALQLIACYKEMKKYAECVGKRRKRWST
jgi:hypothetical protein